MPEKNVKDLRKELTKRISDRLPDTTLFTRVLNDQTADVSNDCLTQMSYVVDYLYDNQIPFHVEQTTSGGYPQLQAVTETPHAKITLTGKGSHIDYIGSGIKANQRYAYTATPYSPNGNVLSGVTDKSGYRPSREDIASLLDVYLKNDMKAFSREDAVRSFSFANGMTKTRPNTYFQNGKLRKSYRTVQEQDSSATDVELLVQPIQAVTDGEVPDFERSVRTVADAIHGAREYLLDEIAKAAPYLTDDAANLDKTPYDYGIDSTEIASMAERIRDTLRDADSDYAIELTGSSDKNTAILACINDYVLKNVLGMSTDPDTGMYNDLPYFDSDDVTVTEEDIPEGFTLDATAVATWSAVSENENAVATKNRLMSAMRGMNLDAMAVVGEDNRNNTVRDAMVRFDEASAKTAEDFPEGSFNRRVLEHTRNYLHELSINAECRIDENGIIDIQGSARGITNNRARDIPVHAQVGQIFSPDEHNVVRVKRRGSESFLFVPGYTAMIEPDDGSRKNMMERTVLTGYYDNACNQINEALSTLVNSTAKTLNSRSDKGVEVVLPTACNRIYGESYGTRLAWDDMERKLAHGFDRDDVYAVYDVLSSKIAYSREMDAHATTLDEIGYQSNPISEPSRALEIAGQNIRKMGDECLGYVYTNMTNNGRGSGTRRYLISTASVAEDGHIIKGDENDMVSPLFSRPMFKNVDHNALDRNVMAFIQTLTAFGVDKGAKGCHMNVEGWTQDDGFVVSREFAMRHTVPDANSEEGKERPLKIGDKISDLNGNKGVINYIVDRDMTREEAEQQKVLPLWELMTKNPSLDFIGAPYFGPSRSNAGVAASMIENHEDLILPDDSVIKGGIGTQPILITDNTVDTKTHVYDDEEDGRKRNASIQMSWIMSAKNLSAIPKEIYGSNEAGFSELKAYLNIVGISVDGKGNLCRGFGEKGGMLVEKRNADVPEGMCRVKKFDEYVLDENAKNPAGMYKLQRKASAARWNAEAKNFNGYLSMPFPVYGADGSELAMDVTDEAGNKSKAYVMPVVSAAFRSDIRQNNGETYSHDFTRNYANIVKSAGEYISAATRLGKMIAGNAAKQGMLPPGMDETALSEKLTDIYLSRLEAVEVKDAKTGRVTNMQQPSGMNENLYGDTSAKRYINAVMKQAGDADQKLYHSLRKEQDMARIAGQSEYAGIVNDTVAKKFEEKKYGAFTECIIRYGCNNSATMTMTADPRLDIDTVAVSQETYDKLGITDGKLLFWRDPLLRDEGMRYFKVVINNDLTGIAMNPSSATMFDGDFDGDGAGVKGLQTAEAQKEAEKALSIKNNILNMGIGAKGHHPLALQDGLDMQAGLAADPELKKRWDDLTKKANKEAYKGGITDDTFKKINDLVHDIHHKGSFANIMSYESEKTVAESLVKMSKEYGNGAKGSVSKMKDFMKYLGFDAEVDKDGNVTDVTKNPLTKAERLKLNSEVCTALGCKCDETGVAGYASKTAIRALRDIVPAATLQLTYPVTQGMLQAKHGAKEARLKAELTQLVVPHLWNGDRMEQSSDGYWSTVKEKKEGERVKTIAKATPEEWKDEFMRVMCQLNGKNINRNTKKPEVVKAFSSIMNPDALDAVCTVLTGEDGKIMGITEAAMKHSCFIDNVTTGIPQPNDAMWREGKKTVTEYLFAEADKKTNIFNNGGLIFAPDSVRESLTKDNTMPSLESGLSGIAMAKQGEYEAPSI